MSTRTLSHLTTHRSRNGLASYFLLGLTAWRQRRALGALDDRLLKDIGLTREDAAREASRPLWDVPDHWLK